MATPVNIRLQVLLRQLSLENEEAAGQEVKGKQRHVGRIGRAQQQRNIRDDDTYLDTLVDPFGYELNRSMWLHNKMPIVAEVPNLELIKNWRTPNDMFYMRHHYPVPNLDEDVYTFTVTGMGITGGEVTISMHDLHTKFPPHTIVATLMCTGNRRSEMQKEVPSTSGLPWKVGGLSTAQWTGARLCDVLAYCGFHFDHPGVTCINFTGKDRSKRGQDFGSTIGLKYVLPHRDVILAYKMNGTDIPHIHGYPVRAIIPGVTAARSIKWVENIDLAAEEHSSHYQRVAYKVWTPNKSFKGVDMSTIPPIMDLPVTGGICSLSDGDSITASSTIIVQGYAFSGGGRAIVRAELTFDEGETWHNCDLVDDGQEDGRKWAWTFWSCELPTPATAGPVRIAFKATDSSHTSMPDTLQGLYNPRGYLTNQWHRLNLTVV